MEQKCSESANLRTNRNKTLTLLNRVRHTERMKLVGQVRKQTKELSRIKIIAYNINKR